jgi:large subunit ribosomal protein L3
MSSYILGKKQGQGRIFDTEGFSVPVTYIDVKDNYVVDVKEKEKDGYNAIKIGGNVVKSVKNNVLGELKKNKIEMRLGSLTEFRVRPDFKKSEKDGKVVFELGDSKYVIGDKIDPAILFKEGDVVDVVGKSKGKGFQGVIKRHGFGRGPKTHGQSDRERAPGSMGAGTTPGRVFKGKKLAGRMGGKRVTVKCLKVLRIEDNMLVVKGFVPGIKGNIVEVKKVTRS